MLKYICDDGDAHVERIRQCIDMQDIRQYVFEVHALKGLMAGIGAKQGLVEAHDYFLPQAHGSKRNGDLSDAWKDEVVFCSGREG